MNTIRQTRSNHELAAEYTVNFTPSSDESYGGQKWPHHRFLNKRTVPYKRLSMGWNDSYSPATFTLISSFRVACSSSKEFGALEVAAIVEVRFAMKMRACGQGIK